jgi:hypothetical protein
MAIDHLNTDSESAPKLLSTRHHDAIVDLLCDEIPSNLFQLCWLGNHGVRPLGQPDLFSFRGYPDGDSGLGAVSLVITGRLLLIYSRTPALAEAFGRWHRDRGMRFEHIVSPTASVAPFWRAYSSPDETGIRARLNRDQSMYVLESDTWTPQKSAAAHTDVPDGLRYATSDDMEEVYQASARMHHEETLEDPIQTKPREFRRHVRHRINSNRSFVWYEGGDLIFKADISARGRFGVQISGVFTEPNRRGQGIATRGMHHICTHLFDRDVPRIVLYFNDDNAPARRVYERVGFSYYTDYQTIFVADPATS